MPPRDCSHLSIMLVSLFLVCPCCLAPGDPISIFLIPGDYIAMLGCRIGTKLKRAFLPPILTPHLTAHHSLLAYTPALSTVAMLAFLPVLLHLASLRAHPPGSGWTQPPADPGCLLPSPVAAVEARPLLHRASL